MDSKRARIQWSQLALAAILLWAAFLRLWNLDATEFKFDEARVATLAARFVDTGIPPVRGMGASTGIDNPPGAIYLFALPALLSRDPWVLSAWVALLNVAAVWGCYRFVRQHWGPAAGLLAALLLASSPWAIFYSRKVWAQNLLLPFALLLFGLLYAWIIDNRQSDRTRWTICGALVTLSFLTQIHFAALALTPVVGSAVVLTLIQRLRRRQAARDWLPLTAGILLALLLYLPYLAADAQEGWSNARALIETTGAQATIQWQALRYTLLNVGGREIHALAGPERYREFLDGILNLNYWPDRIEEALVLLGALYLGIQCIRRRNEPRALARDGLLLLWLVGPALFFLRSSTTVYPHYLLPVYPAPYIVLAIAATQLWTAMWQAHPNAPFRRWMAASAALSLAGLVAWQAYLSLSIHAFVDRHYTPGGMGTPIRIHRQVARTIVDLSRAWNNPQAVLLCPGDEPRWDECPAVYGFMLSRALDLRIADGSTANGSGATVLFPQGEADTLLVLAPGTEGAASLLPVAAQPLPRLDVALRENVARYRFYRLPAGQMYPPDPRAPARLANGVELLGATFSEPPTPGQTTRLLLHWRVREVPPNPPSQGYSFANHLLSKEGQRIAQADGPGRRAALWRSGDTLVSTFDLTLPADAPAPPYHLRIGMYVYTPPDQFVTIPVVDVQGVPIADSVEWPLP